ncbi:DUF2441 domain-containing protein [Bacillus wiedmannii]|uniref:DUF2441 domain-containing protein n=1 Tax=Bacillus wiedmannii TaxID=1890302 RepID=A0AB73SGR1_9BACI|nr:DUF2441 domain-containing protein [Bacillus wiedmannii]PEK24538.1 hypothetical protein CN694_15305 [Bacillus wiedmannii]HDR3490648.1 DUF2441 domain-containing protein [Bacillus wiedmannii]
MDKQEFFAYHIVTKKKMNIGQIIHFDKNQTNILFHFFFEREHLNSSGEDSMQILKEHYTNEELHINNENAKVVMNYMDQTIRAVRETIVEMVRLQEFPEYPSRLSCLYAAKSYEDGIPFSQKIEQARGYWKGNVNNELPELLINGKIEVVEIIDDFSTIHI